MKAKRGRAALHFLVMWNDKQNENILKPKDNWYLPLETAKQHPNNDSDFRPVSRGSLSCGQFIKELK